ncbi:hypothetical protein TGAM01_v210774, partial [Trichoderma gamsii]
RVDISCHLGNNANTRDPDPVTVPWGPNNQDLKIIDGPTALGYIFSVATPPNGATYDNYLVPLQAIYSRCLYLAYIRKIGVPRPVNNATNVPVMSSCIYFRDAGNQLWFLLGSTYTLTYAANGSNKADHNAKRRLMNGWRREQILDPALQSYNPNHYLPSKPYVLPPVLELAVAEAIWLSLFNVDLGNNPAILFNTNLSDPNPWVTVSEDDANAQFQLVVDAVNVAWRAVPNPRDLVPFPCKDLWDRAPFKDSLQAALLSVVRLRWQLGNDRDDAAIQAAYRPVFDIMFVPRMFRPKANNTPNITLGEVNPGPFLPTYMALKDALFSKLYGNVNTSPVLRMLDYLYTWVNAGNDYLAFAGPSVPRPHYTPARALPGALNPSQVRGFAMEVRSFNNYRGGTTAASLAANFSSTTLNNFHDNVGVYRKPCNNCKTLLLELDAPIGTTNYDQDMLAFYGAAIFG